MHGTDGRCLLNLWILIMASSRVATCTGVRMKSVWYPREVPSVHLHLKAPLIPARVV